MSRPRKPTAQKKLEGTNRKSRENKAEPQYPVGLPDPPSYLCPMARKAWAHYGSQMETQRTMSPAFEAVLAAYCESVAEFADLTERMAAGERFLLEEDDQPRKYPIAKERRECMQRMQSLAGDLGLSPASAGKVSRMGEAPEVNGVKAIIARREAREKAREANGPPN